MKTQREIMAQREKNEQYLLDQIEKYSGEPASKETIAWLNMCRGAYKAICMVDEKEYSSAIAAKSANKPAHTPELDGDTELERVFMQITPDKAHMIALFNILSDHMDQLSIVHHKMYDGLMMKFREVARN